MIGDEEAPDVQYLPMCIIAEGLLRWDPYQLKRPAPALVPPPPPPSSQARTLLIFISTQETIEKY